MSTIVRSAASVPSVARLRPLEAAGRRLVQGVLTRIRVGRVELVDLAGRMQAGEGDGTPIRIRVHDPAFYGAVALRGSLGAAESYMEGQWDCDDVASLVHTLLENYDALASTETVAARACYAAGRAGGWVRRNSKPGSRRNIQAHYDLSNEFFALFLDESMTYSSAVFAEPDMTLGAAQREKIDRACRKLRLRAEDHLLEIGTGWGSTAIHAATQYGCRVTTTTISQEQFEYARDCVEAAGVADRVSIVLEDYRELRGEYDKLISIEMIEAVGRAYLDAFLGCCSGLLKPDGLAMIQAIVIRDQFYESAARRVDFLKKYIFPGSCLLGVEAMSRSLRRSTDLRIVGVEDIGLHYAHTLKLWRGRFDEAEEDVRALGFDDRFIRMWRYYLQYCEGAFRAGHCSDMQMLLAKPRGQASGPALSGGID